MNKAKMVKSGIFSLFLSWTSASIAQAPTSEIRDGKPVKSGIFSGVVQIGSFYKNSAGLYNFRQSCNATLIAPTKVLTAAHCNILFNSYIAEKQWDVVKSKDNISVVIKMKNIKARTEADLKAKLQSAGIAFSRAKPKDYTLHPSIDLPLVPEDGNIWNPKKRLQQGLFPDLMILELDSAFPPSITPIRVANKNTVAKLKAGTRVDAVGYGLISENRSSREMRQVSLKLMDLAACRKIDIEIQRARNSDVYNAFPGNSQLCTYEKDKGACSGDSGGPLIIFNNGEPQVVGVTSWGIQKNGKSCSSPGEPRLNVWAKPAHYPAWFDSAAQLDYSIK